MMAWYLTSVCLLLLIGSWRFQRRFAREVEDCFHRIRKCFGLDSKSARRMGFGRFGHWLWLQISEIEEAEANRRAQAENTDFVLSALLQGMEEGVMVVDAEGRVRAVNDALSRIFRLRGEVAGLSYMEAFRNPALHAIIRKTYTEGQALHETLLLSSPESRSLEVNAKPILDAQGAAQGAVLVFHDLTRLRHLEASRKDFVANVSHEIRTPLSIIRGYLETLEENPRLEEADQKKFLGIMTRHAGRISALVGDLLALTRLESQEDPFERKILDIQGMIDLACADFTPAYQKKGMTLRVQSPSSPLPKIRGDLRRLRQALDNLLENALKYSARGTEVIVGASPENESLRLFVTDHGCGISENDLPHIFERFYRADKSRSRVTDNETGSVYSSGTGLGLSIVRQIIEGHGGRAWAKSELGRGSTFYLAIPLDSDAA